jgi:glycosyltransferase involved in cell wall biosynthesis
LEDRGYEVVLISPYDEYALKLQERGNTWIEWKINRRFGGIFSEIKSIIALNRIFQQQHFTVVHVHTLKAILLAGLASLWGRDHLLVNSVAGRGQLYTSNKRVFLLLRYAINLVFRFLKHLIKPRWIFENQADLDYFQKILGSNHNFLIRGVGVDIDRFAPALEPPGVPVVLFVGRFLWAKGIGDLVEAARTLKANQVKVKLKLVGHPDPENSDSVPQSVLSKWVNEDFVEWEGWVEDTPSIYRSANIVALPTRYGEGVPTILLEAAASGRALIASDHPGCKAVVSHGNNGLIIESGDVAGLAKAIKTLAEDPTLRSRMGAKGRKLVEQNFSNIEINQQTLRAYLN